MLVGVHIAHRHQRAVLQLQAWNVVRFGAHAHRHGFVGNQLAQLGVAVIVVGHVANKMRQLVAGVDTLKAFRAVNVVGAVHQPVGIEHDNGVDAHLAAALADLFMPINRRLTAAKVFPRNFREVHRWHVSNFCR